MNSREEMEQRDRERNQRHADECNSRNLPNEPGTVRTTGSRRQYHQTVRSDGQVTVEEI